MSQKCQLVAYYRVSTTKQGMDGYGMGAQHAAVLAHQKSTGCEIVAEYQEVESGKRKDRPELAKAIAHAKRVGATLVIAKLDRLARNVHFLSGLMEGGVDFVACDMPLATRLTIHILAAVAEEEARMISVRTKAALAVAKERGVKMGTPANLTPDARAKAVSTIVANAKSAYGLVAPVMKMLRDQKLSLGAIAKRLNEQGIATRTGASWTPMQVKRVLDRL